MGLVQSGGGALTSRPSRLEVGSACGRRRSVLTAFVALARDIGGTLVAEGVEHPHDLDTVRRLGVAAAQGYLLARPSTASSPWITALLNYAP